MDKESRIAKILIVIAISAFCMFFMFGWYDHHKRMQKSDEELHRRLAGQDMSYELTKKKSNMEKAEKSSNPEEKSKYLRMAEDNGKTIDELEKKWPGLRKDVSRFYGQQ